VANSIYVHFVSIESWLVKCGSAIGSWVETRRLFLWVRFRGRMRWGNSPRSVCIYPG